MLLLGTPKGKSLLSGISKYHHTKKRLCDVLFESTDVQVMRIQVYVYKCNNERKLFYQYSQLKKQNAMLKYIYISFAVCQKGKRKKNGKFFCLPIAINNEKL